MDDVKSFMNGLQLTFECTSDELDHNAMSNCYHRYTMVKNVFAYGLSFSMHH
jgi:hypothetical protein